MPSVPSAAQRADRETGRQQALAVFIHLMHLHREPDQQELAETELGRYQALLTEIDRSDQRPADNLWHGLNGALIDLVYVAVNGSADLKSHATAAHLDRVVALALRVPLETGAALEEALCSRGKPETFRAAVSYGRTAPLSPGALLHAATAAGTSLLAPDTTEDSTWLRSLSRLLSNLTTERL